MQAVMDPDGRGCGLVVLAVRCRGNCNCFIAKGRRKQRAQRKATTGKSGVGIDLTPILFSGEGENNVCTWGTGGVR